MLKRVMTKIADDMITPNKSKSIRFIRKVIDSFKIPNYPERHKDRYKDSVFTTKKDIKELKKKLNKP